MKASEKSQTKGKSFVEYVLTKIGKNTGMRAALARADNPATEYQSWEVLAPWCDIEREESRLPFAVVGAYLARRKATKDGMYGIGRAIARCYDTPGAFDGQGKDPARAKLRRLIACKNVPEACEILRPILNLCSSRGVAVNNSKLLDDLIYFNADTPARWAADFYRVGDKV